MHQNDRPGSLSHNPGTLHFRRFLLLVVLASVSSSAHAQVRVREGTLTLPVYSEGLPAPNPPFEIYSLHTGTTDNYNEVGKE
jgi:hypothetical protein